MPLTSSCCVAPPTFRLTNWWPWQRSISKRFLNRWLRSLCNKALDFCCDTFHFVWIQQLQKAVKRSAFNLVPSPAWDRDDMQSVYFNNCVTPFDVQRAKKNGAYFFPDLRFNSTKQKERELWFQWGKYWLCVLLRWQMFGLKRVKGERGACGRSLLPPLPRSAKLCCLTERIKSRSSLFLILEL